MRDHDALSGLRRIGLADTCIAAFQPGDHSPSDPDKIRMMRERFSHFESAEAYTPIFDANAKELQSLSVKVLINITSFYTYWKAMRDAFRRLAKASSTMPTTSSISDDDEWHRAMANVLYMQFLAPEGARKAIRDLIEFQPNRAENTIMILIGSWHYTALLKSVSQKLTSVMNVCSYDVSGINTLFL